MTSRPRPMATVLSFTTPEGNLIAQALHRDGPGGIGAHVGNWPRRDGGEPALWALQLGPELWRRDQHLLLPQELQNTLQPLEATTEAEALEALDRAALALEDFLEDFAALQVTLGKRVAGALAHGKTPELPLGTDCPTCEGGGEVATGETERDTGAPVVALCGDCKGTGVVL